MKRERLGLHDQNERTKNCELHSEWANMQPSSGITQALLLIPNMQRRKEERERQKLTLDANC